MKKGQGFARVQEAGGGGIAQRCCANRAARHATADDRLGTRRHCGCTRQGRFTLRGIPLEAYDYVVNGKPALEWVMERQSVTTDKDSGIVNDANLCATETMNNPAYPLELFLRVITVSLETLKIVNGLPGMEI